MKLRNVGLGLFFATSTLLPTVTAAENCADFLANRSFSCRAVTETGRQFTLPFKFVPPASGTKLDLQIAVNPSGGPQGACTCNAKKLNLKKPAKIQFDVAKNFHCYVAAPEFTGPEYSGPEGSFALNQAEFHGLAGKKGIKKGEAVDNLGRALANDCPTP